MRVRVDVATHALVPMAAALAALGFWARDEPQDRRKAAFAAVFGLAGAAPDLDGLIDPLSEWFDSLYWLQHRGVSHTFAGAPIFGLILLLALSAGAAAWPRRMGLFAFRPRLVVAAATGAWTHLVLDAVTYSGVPLLWPFVDGRFGFMLFHWLVFWLFPVGAIVLGLHMIGRLSRRRVVQAGALVVVVLLVLAGVRAASRPDVEDGQLVFPTKRELSWVVATPHANGTWVLETHRLGDRSDAVWFEPNEPEAATDAIARAKATDAYRGFRMGSFGPQVVVAVQEAAGWNVTILDIAQRYEAMHAPRWAPSEPYEEWGYVRFLVRDDGIDVLHRGW